MMEQLGTADAVTAYIESVARRAIDAAIRDGRLKPAAAAPVLKRALTQDEVAKLYNIPKSTLADWRRESKGPAWTKPGKQVLYRVVDLEAFFEAQRVRTLQSDQLAGSAR